jgi:glycosyltransferase involved in cell wall biosynthesis
MESHVKTFPALPEIAVNGTAPLPMTDLLREQFERIQRQPELAADMRCFSPGEDLSTIRYMANAHSVHVARWVKILSHTKARVEIDTANPIPAFSNDFVSAIPALPQWLRIPMVLRYALAGLKLRFWRSPSASTLIHAHGASGNGFMAWLSGQRYVIGTYGSEIYSAKERGTLYCWLMSRILQRAERISVCSSECTKVLIEQFGIPLERIYNFHIGYDDVSFLPLEHQKRMQLRRERQLPVDEPIWVVNRRTHPHYRTKDVVEGFLKYCQQGGQGRLVLLCGDQQADYTKSICDLIRSHASGDRIVVVERMLAPPELASWLQLGDFSISVPRTDNFSISTLESMGCGTVPILANLEAYCLLRPCKSVRWMTTFDVTDFANVFAETSKSWPISHDSQRKDCFQFVHEGFSTEGAIRDIAAFYLGTPLLEASSSKRAA